MYFLLAHQLERQNSLYLLDEVETLGHMARLPGFAETLVTETHPAPVGDGYLTLFVRLLRRDGSTEIETNNMDDILPSSMFPAAHPGRGPAEEVKVHDQHGTSYIVTSLVIGSGSAKGGTLQVGLDVSNVESILAAYRLKLGFTLILGSLLCTLTGLIIARRGTRPILELTERAKAITVSGLKERLTGDDWPEELSSLAATLNAMLDRLQDSFSRLYNSVANLTHKLRTPLTILRGEAEIALSRERSNDELCEVIESSMEEFGRLSHLVDNIVLIAQAEAGKLKLAAEPLEVAEEADKLLEYYEPLAEEKGITLSCQGRTRLTVDPTLFRKVLANLVSNALTITPEGGTVTISARQRDDRWTEISVSDTGCGISDEDLPRIFDRFYRVYATRFLNPHGSGLGLPLVKTIMDLHKGSIDVASSPGAGTTVTLLFPASR